MSRERINLKFYYFQSTLILGKCVHKHERYIGMNITQKGCVSLFLVLITETHEQL